MYNVYTLLFITLAACLTGEAFGMMQTNSGSEEGLRGRTLTKSFRPADEPVPDDAEEVAPNAEALQSQRLYEKIPLVFDPQRGMECREVKAVGNCREAIQNQEQLIQELSRQLSDQEEKASSPMISEQFREVYRKNTELLRQALLQEGVGQVTQ